MKDYYFDVLILALVGWLVYDRMKEKKAGTVAAVVKTGEPVLSSTEAKVAAMLASDS